MHLALIAQLIGAILILAAFAGQQAGRLSASSPSYLAANLVGSAVLAVLALAERQWGFLLLEGVWALVTAWSISRLLRGLPPRAG